MAAVVEGTILWEPSPELKRNSNIQAYIDWLARHKNIHVADYSQLWSWSVADLAGFWGSITEFYDLHSSQPHTAVLEISAMPGARWFPGARLNYAEHVFRNGAADRPAILFQSELQPLVELSWEQLRHDVAAVATSLRAMGAGPGDRVVAYLPNMPQAVIALLACASLGAIWSSCSPDMGAASVVDRFKQIEPVVLFAVDGYVYNGKAHDRRAVVAELQAAMPSLRQTVLVPYLDPAATTENLAKTVLWTDLVVDHIGDLPFEQVPFDHPLWVLYSSGTTGLPKPIVHGHGGILLEHLKSLSLHLDLKPDDRFFWFSTTGWMMWNFLVSGLLVGSTIVLFDGSPACPDMGTLWSLAERTGMTFFGASAAYVGACMKAAVDPGWQYDLGRLKGLGSTGSPLPVEGFEWVYQHVKPDLWLASISGGTDLCTAFVGGCPLLPVHAGEIQCRCLGASVQAFDPSGRAVVDEVGELVLTKPMPSMPIFFWNDPDFKRYRESYFEMYPDIWRHGDWVKVTERETLVIYGRSDSTINRMGVRMGTSELYAAVEEIPEVLDSLVVDLEGLGGRSYMPLFIVLRQDASLDAALQSRIKDAIRRRLSARHVPDAILVIPEVPRTLNGKKLEVPIKKILLGVPLERAANPDSMSNPHMLAFFADLAATLRPASAEKEP